jgi:hypothetical protein
MFFFKLFAAFSQTNFFAKFSKMLPTLIVVGVIGGVTYFGYTYLETMKATVEATKKQTEVQQEQLEEIKKANAAIAEDMKGVKELTDKFNSQLGAIRSNQNTLTNAVTSQKFKGDVTANVPAAQESLNQSFNKLFKDINGVTNAK